MNVQKQEPARFYVRPWPERDFDCHCCHGAEAHAIEGDSPERGKCLKKDCDCKHYGQARPSAFIELLTLVDGLLSREDKMKALLAEDFDLEAWLDRYRSVPWPAKPVPRKEAS